jgi:hypothetical protein
LDRIDPQSVAPWHDRSCRRKAAEDNPDADEHRRIERPHPEQYSLEIPRHHSGTLVPSTPPNPTYVTV